MRLRSFRFFRTNVSPTREREKPLENQRVEQPFANRLETQGFRAAGQIFLRAGGRLTAMGRRQGRENLLSKRDGQERNFPKWMS
jgi:hypothetical protein